MDVLQQMVDFTKVVKLGLCLIAKLEFVLKVSMEDGKCLLKGESLLLKNTLKFPLKNL